MFNTVLNMYEPPPQRQIRRARLRVQTLRRAAHNDRNRRARPALQDIGARLFADAADAHREYHVAVERNLEVAREGEEVRLDAGEGSREACGWETLASCLACAKESGAYLPWRMSRPHPYVE
jgi:hypothetical protein